LNIARGGVIIWRCNKLQWYCHRLLLYDVDSFAHYNDYNICKVDKTLVHVDGAGGNWLVDSNGFVKTLDGARCTRRPRGTVIRIFYCTLNTHCRIVCIASYHTMRYIRYDSVYLTCSKKLTGSHLSLPHGTSNKLKCETKNKMMSVIGPVQSRYREAV